MNQSDKDQTNKKGFWNDKKGFWKNYAIFVASWSWRVWLIGAIFFVFESARDFNKHSYIYASLELVLAISWFFIALKKVNK